LSFKSFLGLSLSDPVPDDTTFCRFRQKLQEEGLLKKLFSLLDGQFEDLGILVKRGSFIDATIVQAQRRPPSKEAKKEEAESGDTAFAGNVEGKRQNEDEGFIGITRNGKIYYKSDPDARWTVKRGKFPCGYKVHVNADESGIVGRLEMTPANVHDSSKQ
jgi:IS5 family transposase